MKAYIPDNLDLSKERHKDKYHYIITVIYYGRILDKRNNSFTFIPINGRKLKHILGGRCKKYINQLKEWGIVETNNQYFVGKIAKGYRLTEKYREAKFRRIEIFDVRIISNYAKQKKLFELDIKHPYHKYLYTNLTKVEIDYKGATDYIDQNIKKTKRHIIYSLAVERIANKEYFFMIDPLSGRVYNNIVNLPKELRDYLSYDNKKLVEVDIRNSQPFLFNILIQSFIKSNKNLIRNYSSYGHHTLTEYPNYSDVELYKKLTSEGVFYEYLMPYFPTADRGKFKKKLFGRVYYNDERAFFYEEWGCFQDIFPIPALAISHYKKDNYKNLAHKLQKAEADIMINKVVPQLADKKIFALTIHDSILTTPDKAQSVKKIILDEFIKNYGLKPSIKIKGE